MERRIRLGSCGYLPMYFFSNSPVKWRLTKVVFPVPPSPTMLEKEEKEDCGDVG